MSGKLFAEHFWIDRWMRSTAVTMPLEARGLYREMLSQAWIRGAKLPVEPDAIRRVTGCTQEEWDRSWPLVAPYWRIHEFSLINDTQQDIYAKQLAAHERASARGRKGRRKQLRLSRGSSRAQAGLDIGSRPGNPRSEIRDPRSTDVRTTNPDAVLRSPEVISDKKPTGADAPERTDEKNETKGNGHANAGRVSPTLRDRDGDHHDGSAAGLRRVEGTHQGPIHAIGFHVPATPDADRSRAVGGGASSPAAAPEPTRGDPERGPAAVDGRGITGGAGDSAATLHATIDRLREQFRADADRPDPRVTHAERARNERRADRGVARESTETTPAVPQDGPRLGEDS